MKPEQHDARVNRFAEEPEDRNADELRVNDCLYNYCPRRTEECARCDAVVAILRKYRDPDEGVT